MAQILVTTLLQHMGNKAVVGDNQYGFTKGQSFMINLVAFYDVFRALVDRRRVTDVIFLDMCKAFDIVLCDILVSKLEGHSFDVWTTQCIRNGLDSPLSNG